MSQQIVILWDLLIRCFHWSIAIIFFSNCFLNEAGEDWHQWLGYGALAWIFIRFIWGFIGGRAARWSDFLPTYSRLSLHIRALITGKPYHRMGHSPLGALVMILMMMLIFSLGVSGFMMQEIDYFWGEDWVQGWHKWSANTLEFLVLGHIVAAITESIRVKENLPLSMITGKRRNIIDDSKK